MAGKKIKNTIKNKLKYYAFRRQCHSMTMESENEKWWKYVYFKKKDIQKLYSTLTSDA